METGFSGRHSHRTVKALTIKEHRLIGCRPSEMLATLPFKMAAFCLLLMPARIFPPGRLEMFRRKSQGPRLIIDGLMAR
jgi:hypothetical protein